MSDLTPKYYDSNSQGIEEYTVSAYDGFITSGLGDNPALIKVAGQFYLAGSIVQNINCNYWTPGDIGYGRGTKGKRYVKLTNDLIEELTNHYEMPRKLSAKQQHRRDRIDQFALELIELI